MYNKLTVDYFQFHSICTCLNWFTYKHIKKVFIILLIRFAEFQYTERQKTERNARNQGCSLFRESTVYLIRLLIFLWSA